LNLIDKSDVDFLQEAERDLQCKVKIGTTEHTFFREDICNLADKNTLLQKLHDWGIDVVGIEMISKSYANFAFDSMFKEVPRDSEKMNMLGALWEPQPQKQ